MKPKDRDYYACLSSDELQEEIKYGINVDWHELCVALATRLADTKRTLRDYRYDLAAERYDYEQDYEG